MEIMTIEEARETLRLDNEHNDDIIMPLLAAIPSYLEIQTGKDWLEEDAEKVDALAKTTAQFILLLWYNPQQRDEERLKRTINSLIYALTAKAKD